MEKDYSTEIQVSFKEKLAVKKWLIPIFGLSLLLLIVLGSVVLVSHPVVWEKIHRPVMKEKLKEIHFEDANRITAGLWNSEPYKEISQNLNYWKKMNEKEIAHYEDVRNLLGTARVVIIVCALSAVIGFLIFGWKKIWLSSLASFILLGVIAGFWMMIHWHSLFKALHWVIFWDDSWKLPAKSYSLALFPHSVWQQAGGVIAVLIFIPLALPLLSLLFNRNKQTQTEN